MRRSAVLACLVAGSLLATPALAQAPAAGEQVVVTLKSGASFRGTLVGQDERTLTLRSAAGTVRTLPRSSVGLVQKAPEAPPPVAAAPVESAPPAAAVTTTREAVTVATPAQAQAQPAPVMMARPAVDDGQARVGLGVALPDAGGFPSFYVPIQVSRGFRVEPELGLVRLDVGGQSATALQLGLGLLGTSAVAPQVGAYGGLRLQVQRLDASGTDGYTNTRIAVVVGGEWQPVTRVALGVEAQVAYVIVDRALTASSSSASGLATAGLFFVRIFLN